MRPFEIRVIVAVRVRVLIPSGSAETLARSTFETQEKDATFPMFEVTEVSVKEAELSQVPVNEYLRPLTIETAEKFAGGGKLVFSTTATLAVPLFPAASVWLTTGVFVPSPEVTLQAPAANE